MLSYRADMHIDTNAFELGFGHFVDLNLEAEFVGKAALSCACSTLSMAPLQRSPTNRSSNRRSNYHRCSAQCSHENGTEIRGDV